MNRHVLSILVENQAGVLSRGYNIDSLSVGVTEDDKYSRITVVVTCDENEIIQIIKQVEKLVDVIRVVELDTKRAMIRELALIKVKCDSATRAQIASVVDIFRANIIDVATEALTIEMTGTQTKIQALIDLIEPYGIKEIVRTGVTALCRGNGSIKRTK